MCMYFSFSFLNKILLNYFIEFKGVKHYVDYNQNYNKNISLITEFSKNSI